MLQKSTDFSNSFMASLNRQRVFQQLLANSVVILFDADDALYLMLQEKILKCNPPGVLFKIQLTTHFLSPIIIGESSHNRITSNRPLLRGLFP